MSILYFKNKNNKNNNNNYKSESMYLEKNKECIEIES